MAFHDHFPGSCTYPVSSGASAWASCRAWLCRVCARSFSRHIIIITIYHYLYYYYCYYFFCFFGDTRRLLLQFSFLWSIQCERWMAFKIALHTAEMCSRAKFSSGALLKQLLGSSFLDFCLKSESHVTSDLKYFNSVVWIMVSNTVEALSFPPAPRLSYPLAY